ncbi:MAG TPA: hypothetical protein VFO25_08435 [Candidatus Eremiobacteraceae bacterium]|nr:hypothetical protein [Candidatus Eremiobacteraceae bacterium]
MVSDYDGTLNRLTTAFAAAQRSHAEAWVALEAATARRSSRDQARGNDFEPDPAHGEAFKRWAEAYTAMQIAATSLSEHLKSKIGLK